MPAQWRARGMALALLDGGLVVTGCDGEATGLIERLPAGFADSSARRRVTHDISTPPGQRVLQIGRCPPADSALSGDRSKCPPPLDCRSIADNAACKEIASCVRAAGTGLPAPADSDD